MVQGISRGSQIACKPASGNQEAATYSSSSTAPALWPLPGSFSIQAAFQNQSSCVEHNKVSNSRVFAPFASSTSSRKFSDVLVMHVLDIHADDVMLQLSRMRSRFRRSLLLLYPKSKQTNSLNSAESGLNGPLNTTLDHYFWA